MIDSRYYCFLPVPPSWCPDLIIAVSCDLTSLCAVQVLITTAISGVFSGRGWERRREIWIIFPMVHCFKCLPHPCRLGEDLAREDEDSRCNGNFLEEPLLGMMLLHCFLAIHFTQGKYSEKKIVVQTETIRECFPAAMPIAEEEMDFPLLCFVDTWQSTV